MDRLLPEADVAELLGVSRPTVRRMLRAGELPQVWVHRGARRVRLSDVEAYIAARVERRHQPDSHIEA